MKMNHFQRFLDEHGQNIARGSSTQLAVVKYIQKHKLNESASLKLIEDIISFSKKGES